MIVRGILINPDLSNDFDFPNDYQNTKGWLERLDTFEASIAIRVLDQAAEVAGWIRSMLLKIEPNSKTCLEVLYMLNVTAIVSPLPLKTALTYQQTL